MTLAEVVIYTYLHASFVTTEHNITLTLTLSHMNFEHFLSLGDTEAHTVNVWVFYHDNISKRIYFLLTYPQFWNSFTATTSTTRCRIDMWFLLWQTGENMSFWYHFNIGIPMLARYNRRCRIDIDPMRLCCVGSSCTLLWVTFPLVPWFIVFATTVSSFAADCRKVACHNYLIATDKCLHWVFA